MTDEVLKDLSEVSITKVLKPVLAQDVVLQNVNAYDSCLKRMDAPIQWGCNKIPPELLGKEAMP